MTAWNCFQSEDNIMKSLQTSCDLHYRCCKVSWNNDYRMKFSLIMRSGNVAFPSHGVVFLASSVAMSSLDHMMSFSSHFPFWRYVVFGQNTVGECLVTCRFRHMLLSSSIVFINCCFRQLPFSSSVVFVKCRCRPLSFSSTVVFVTCCFRPLSFVVEKIFLIFGNIRFILYKKVFLRFAKKPERKQMATETVSYMHLIAVGSSYFIKRGKLRAFKKQGNQNHQKHGASFAVTLEHAGLRQLFYI